MRLPKTISVLGEVYRVKRVNRLIERHQMEGYVDAHRFEIGIDKGLKGRILERVWLHELGHAFAYEIGLHEFMNEQSLEMFCQGFASFLAKL